MSDDIDRPGMDKREFARIPVHWMARVKTVDEDQAEHLQQELSLRPSVWEPANETTLRDLVVNGSGSHEAILAQAVLEISAELVRLRTRMEKPDPAFCEVDVVELSGGGGRIVTRLPMNDGDSLELRFEPDDELPPIRALIHVVHKYEDPQHGYGFAFRAIHPHDQDRMIRLIYQLQRRALREAHLEEEESRA